MLTQVGAILALAAASAYSAPQDVNPHSAILEDFNKRVAEYVKLHKNIEGKSPKLKSTSSSEGLRAHEKKLAHEIREARRKAKQGDIFTPEIAQEFRRLMRLAVQGDPTPVKQSLKRAEPVTLALRINDPYPDPSPLQSTPPTLLANLPKLPPELDYRIIGGSLALRDVKANLILDFIPNAIP